MAFNPYYNPYYQPPLQDNLGMLRQQQMPQTAPQANNGLIWVQGEAGAKSYLTAPNTTVLLMDSETDRFFLKSSDASGMPLPLRIFTYSETTAQKAASAPSVNTGEYITRKEFDEFKADLLGREGKDEQLV